MMREILTPQIKEEIFTRFYATVYFRKSRKDSAGEQEKKMTINLQILKETKTKS